MFKIVIFSDQTLDFSSWATWLERDFEITHVTQVESLAAVLDTWSPNVFIYSEKSLNLDTIARLISNRGNKAALGWVVIAHQYDLRDELKSFESGADHYLLFKTPTESVRARLINTAKKNSPSLAKSQVGSLVQLPQNRETLTFDEIGLTLSNGALKIQGEIRSVTPTQYRLVEALLGHANTPLSREWIRENVFKNSRLSLRSIDAQIAKVKKAIPELRGQILNLYGRGYVLKPSRQKALA